MIRFFTQSKLVLLQYLIAACFVALVAGDVQAQVVIETTVPANLSVCNPGDTFSIKVLNQGASAWNNPQITTILPTGIEYKTGSLVETTMHGAFVQNGVNPQQPVFSVNSLPAGDSLQFSIVTDAYPAAIDYLQLGNTFRNEVVVQAGGNPVSHLSTAYNLLYAALSITQLNPVSQSVSYGQAFSRTITVANAGYGRIDAFQISDIRALAGLNLTATSVGTLSASGDTILLSGTDFAGVGNGDAWFDSNESITITETLSPGVCQNATITSELAAHWGCSGTERSTTVSYAHATVSYPSPNLSVSVNESLNACFGTGAASEQSLTISNTGAGQAKSVQLDVFKSSGSGYNEDIFSRIDQGSLEYRIDNGNWQSISPTAVYATRTDGAWSCLGAGAIGRAILSLPDLDAGRSMTVRWDMYHCNISVCNGDLDKGWRYELDYEDQCNIQAYAREGQGQAKNADDMSLFSESPSDIHDGETKTITYTVSSYANTQPEGQGAALELVFDLPVGLAYNNGVNDLSFTSGPNTWTASAITYDAVAHKLTARYPMPAPFLIPKAEINLNVVGDCSMPNAAAGTVYVNLEVDYLPADTCGTEPMIPMVCGQSVDLDLHCPSPGPCEGLKFLGYDISRTSFGQPDNDQDGLADASGSLNPAKIKANRAMVGDTLRGSFSGLVGTSVAHPQWDYAYAETEIVLGSNLTQQGAILRVYDASQQQYLECAQVPVTSQTSGNNRTFSYDLSPASLASACGAFSGFQFEDGDSVWVYADYTVTGNIGGDVQEVKATNSFYVSDQANPSIQDQYQCDFYNDKFTLIGYFFSNSWKTNYSVKSCTKVVQQNYWFSVGNCCSNYAGGNLFPYEYRNWAHISEARIIVPQDYTVIEAYTRYRRTRYTNSSSTNTIDPITPSSQDNNVLTYDLAQHYSMNGGSVPLSDDGFHGTIYVELAPTCDVPAGEYRDIHWEMKFGLSDLLGGGETGWYSAQPDRIRFTPTQLDISSTNPVIDGLEKTVTWYVNIRNTTGNTDASSVWLHTKNPSGQLDILEIRDLDVDQVLSLTGDIYRLGTINRNKTRKLAVTAKYNACSVDFLWTYAGYECAGYPASFYQFACPYSQMELRVEPKPAGLQSIINGNTIGDACGSTVEVTVEVASVKLAVADSIEVSFTLPANNSLTYNNASSMFRYPLGTTATSGTDPAQSGNTYTYAIGNYNTGIGDRGLPGVLKLDSNRFRLSFQLNQEANFQPGDFVQVSVSGQEACGQPLPVINMAYDPSVKFEKNVLSGLSDDAGNSWGLAWVDYDGDGWEDVFVTEYDKQTGNGLYRNNADGTFTRITNAGPLVTDLGAAVSSTWADYDNDGDIDAFVAYNTGAVNGLYQNQGDGTFIKVSGGDLANYGGYCHNASWGDYDNDGHLDLIVTEYFPTLFNLLYHNNGDGTFTRVSDTPINLKAAQSIGASWCDYDGDGDLDAFVPNTNGYANGLYRNEGGGEFVAVTTGPVVTDVSNSVGGSWGDYDNDGDMDLFVANSSDQNNALYQNNGDGTFTKVTSGIVVSDGGNSHGSAWADFDNDGDLDLFVSNDQQSPNCLYTNNGDGTFSKPDNVINTDLADSFGAAWGDHDNDGDLDLLVANRDNAPNDFYTNSKGACNSWACFKLEGVQSNRSAIGATIRVKANIYGQETWQMREISAQTGGGAGAQNSLRANFGLGDATIIDSVRIDWPSGMIQYLTNLSVDQCQDVLEESGALVAGKAFFDENSNCVLDSNEQVLSRVKIDITPSDKRLATDDLGAYSTYLPVGSYTIEADPGANWTDICGGSKVTHSVTVSGTPGETYTGLNFPLQALSSQPDLSVHFGMTALRRGFQNTLVITYENHGPVAADNATLQFVSDPDVILLSADVPWNTVENNTYTWELGTVPVNGRGVIHVTDSVSVQAILDELKTLTATIATTTTESDYTNNTHSASEPIVGSVDPNDKLAFPPGLGMRQLIAADQELTYRIRFQNVGNYMASRVIIVDTLSQYLDLQSIDQVIMSHEGVMEVSSDGVMRVHFPGIELPDSLSDEPNSHGFIQFRIKPKANVMEGARITNRAAIIFDYNEPLITNTVVRQIATEWPDENALALHIYPNPSSGKSWLTVKSLIDTHFPVVLKQVRVFDLSGMQVGAWQATGDRFELRTTGLPDGFYLVEAVVDLGSKKAVLTGKLGIAGSYGSWE